MSASPEPLAEQGRRQLLAGNPEAAVVRLDRAVALAPHEVNAWSDLAAAHLVLPQDPQHVVAALIAADRAAEIDPSLKEALFNRAVALQRLCLLSEARVAWERYLAANDDPGWTTEAEARRAELRHPSEAERWKPMPAMLRRASLRKDDNSIERVVSRFPQRARLYAEEELLAEWAQAVWSGREETAAQALAEARNIGDALTRAHGDRLLLETVEAIERAGGADRDHLAAGHLAFQKGLSKIQAQDPEGAGPPLEKSLQILRKAGSPFSLWASFRLGHRDYLIGATDRALARFRQLRRIAGEHSYKSLGGRASWLMGTVLLFQGRPSESLAALDRAAEILSELREVNNTAGVHMLLARNLDFLGDSQGAWIHRLAALRGAVDAGDADRMRLVFADAAWDFPEPRIALYFQTEAVRAARQLKDPGHLATALRQRAAIRHRLGDWAGALSDLRDSQTEANHLTSETARTTTLYELRLTEAQIRRERDPAGALAAAEAALALGKDRYFIPALLVERSRAHAGLGDLIAAERDLESATAEIERQRDEVDESLRRASYLDQAREAFERLVDLRLANDRGNEAALNAAEKTRSRVLFEWVANLPQGVPGRAAALRAPVKLRPVADLRRKLPPGTVAIEYLIREDRTLAWVFSSDRVELVVLPEGAATLERRWQTWRQALRGRDGGQEKRAASDLYQLLVAPLASYLHPRDTLAFIPDKTLYAVPFGALLDPATGRRLIQDRTLFVAPSANLLTICLERASALRTSSAAGALIVADPDLDPALRLDLLSLPAARAEAKIIAALHTPARILSGSEATKSRFLSEAGRYGIVHFVGHALRHRDNPLLSALVLAPDPSFPSASLLYAHELLGRRFDSTRLVVLSACSTGVAAPAKTEGALSLAAPFLAAGIPAVVASLWDVSDATSAPLMSSFHRHLHQGEDVAAALRAAQIELLTSRNQELAAPRAWAPFELIGAQ